MDDGSGGTATDEVTIRATNQAPQLTGATLQGTQGGASLLTATITDPGLRDRASATVHWGDGSPAEAAIVTQGRGWATIVAAHRYANAGTYPARIVVTDGDGGSAEATRSTAISRPGAIWADSTTDPFLGFAFNWLGLGGDIRGNVHSNASAKFAGLGNTVEGSIQYVKSFWRLGLGQSLPTPTKVAVAQAPAGPAIADFAPGGAIARSAGTAYYDMSSRCSGGVWAILTPNELAPGVYYAPCNINVAAIGARGKVTLAATGSIRFSGKLSEFSPYHDGLLAFSSKSGGDSISVIGAFSKLLGRLDGRRGDVEISGANVRLSCGLIGSRVRITGADIDLTGGDCAAPQGTVADARVVPSLQTGLTVDKARALPGDPLKYTANVAHTGADLFLAGVAGVDNAGTANATVTSSRYELQYLDAGNTWRTISSSAGSGDDRAALRVLPMASPGVTYPASGEPDGTTVAGGRLAAWGYQARVRLAAGDLALLYDPARARAVRSVLRLTTSGEPLVRELSPAGADITARLRAASPDLRDVQIVTTLPSGASRTFDSAEVSGLASIAPGATRTIEVPFTAAALAQRQDHETVAAYAERLRRADGRGLRGASRVRATAGGFPVFGTQDQATALQQVPVIEVELAGPAALAAGEQAPTKTTLQNRGGAAANELTLQAGVTGGASFDLDPAPATIAAGATADVAGTVLAGDAAGVARLSAALSWRDANGNSYGDVEVARSIRVRTAPTLRVVKAANLIADVDENGRISVGDTIEYVITAENQGTSPLGGVEIADPVPAELSVVDGSASVTQGTVEVETNAELRQHVKATVGELEGGTAATLRFRAHVLPLRTPTTKTVTVSNQAIVTSDALAPERSDDPGTPEADDPTLVAVYPSTPKLDLNVRGRVLVDPNGDDQPSAGETVRYTFTLDNNGDRAATGVRVRIPQGKYLSFVPGSLTSSSGPAELRDGVVEVTRSQFGVDDRLTVAIDARIDAALPDAVSSIGLQGFAYANEDAVGVSAASVLDLVIEPRLELTKTAELAEDRDGNGAISTGDIVAYRLVATNPTVAAAAGVVVDDEFDAATTLVAGSLQLTSGTTSVTGRNIKATIGTLPGGASATLRYSVLVGQLGENQYELGGQASASSPGLRTVPSDDPASPGAQDSTSVPVVRTPTLPPSLSSTKRDWLAIDADANGKVSPGDTLAYEVTISNGGPGPGTGIVATDAVDPHTELIIGSVQAGASTVIEGNGPGDTHVRVEIGTLAAGATARFTYQVRIPGSLPAGTTTLESPGTVSSNEAAPVTTTDPDAPPGAPKVTVTEITGPDVVAPGARQLTPRDGATVTARTPVTAEITPATGQDVASWCLYSVRIETGEQRTVRCQEGPPSGPEIATFDPTVLPNGPYELKLVVMGSGGGERTTRSTVNVEGALKPGRFVTSYTDMDIPVQTLPIRVTRSYDSFDKSEGDFGVGWRVGLDGFRVTVNRPLGDGGWTHVESDCWVLLGERFCTSTEFEDLSSHTVTVTWPDGRAETFDFTPKAEVGGVVLGGNAGFTGRRGTTSKLKAAGDQSVTYLGMGGIYESDGETIYNPQRFELTGKDGTVYLLDVKAGLISSRDPHGNTLEVSDSGVISSTGASVEFTRDGQGRIVRMEGPSGEGRSYAYDAAGDLVSVTDALDHTVRYEYDGDHNLVKTLDPSGRPTSRFEYDEAGRLSKIIDAEGNETTLEVRDGGREQLATSPDGKLTTIKGFDPRGNTIRVEQVFDGRSLVSTYAFDSNDNQTRETNPLGQSTTATFDARSNKLTEADALGNTTRYEYDSSSRVAKVTAPGGGETTIVRDEFGEPTSVTDPVGGTTHFSYDSHGNVSEIRDALGRLTTFDWDARGNRTSVTAPGGATATSAYDASGRATSTTSPDAGTMRMERDDEGRATALVDALGHRREFRYDAQGQLSHAEDATGAVSEFRYDAAGNLQTTIDRSGRTRTTTYDAFGAPLRILSDSDAVEYRYDALGRTVEANNSAAAISIAYDDGDRPLHVTSQQPGEAADVVNYAYDAAGRVAARSFGGTTESLTRNASGELTSVTATGIGRFDMAVDLTGRRTSMTRPNGVSTTWAADALGRTTAIEHRRGAAVLDFARYSYNASGRRSELQSPAGTSTFSYDDAGRLESADYPAGRVDETWQYDVLGNRLGDGERYDDASRLVGRDGWTYEYDADGRQKRRLADGGAPTDFTWDEFGRLGSTQSASGSHHYRYDALGRRIRVSGPDGTRTYVYGVGGNPIARRSGGQTTRFVFDDALDRPLAMRRGAQTTFFEQDAVGSVTSLTSETGSLIERIDYDAFGRLAQPSDAALTPFTYTGREYNPETATYHYRAREYDPAIGRFLSEDPVASENQYWYADANPVEFNDPLGLMANLNDFNAAESAGEPIRKTHLHHSIPKQIQKFLTVNKNRNANNSKIRGRKGCRNRVEVEADYHLNVVHDKKGYPRGKNRYNQMFEDRIHQAVGLDLSIAEAYQAVSLDDILKIRDELLEEFDIGLPGCE